MDGNLVTLPLRLSLRTTALALRGARSVTGAAWHTGEQVLELGEHALGLVLPRRFGHSESPGNGSGRDESATQPSPAREPEREGEAGSSGTPRASREAASVRLSPSDVPRHDPRRGNITNGSEPPVADPRPARTAPPAEAQENVVDFSGPAAPLRGEGHVSEEVELVEERADPGAENGAGAQLNIAEPWPGYREMKARDVVARLDGANATELLAARLFEVSNRGRASVLSAIDSRLGGTAT